MTPSKNVSGRRRIIDLKINKDGQENVKYSKWLFLWHTIWLQNIYREFLFSIYWTDFLLTRWEVLFFYLSLFRIPLRIFLKEEFWEGEECPFVFKPWPRPASQGWRKLRLFWPAPLSSLQRNWHLISGVE